MATGGDSKEYIKVMIFVFIAFASFVIAITAGYFATVGLYFGQAVVEGDVWTDYKYECINASQSASECTAYNTSATTSAYNNYVLQRDEINSTSLLFLSSVTVIFSLLGLVMLFLALKSAGLFSGNKKDKREEF